MFCVVYCELAAGWRELFKRAIPMSGGFHPMSGRAVPEAIYKGFESRVECMVLIVTSFRHLEGDGGADEGLLAVTYRTCVRHPRTTT